VRISLIEPKSPDYHIYSKTTLPRLGLPILGTMLRDRGHQVSIYVEDLLGIGSAAAWDILKSDLVGISCTSATAPRAYAMALLLRLRGIPVVFGGVHPTFMPEEPARHGDYVIVGEAEEALPLLVEALEGGSGFSHVPNLLYREDGRMVRTEQRALPMGLDEIPIPDFSLIHGNSRMRIKPVMTTRGCPHNCSFCCVSPMFGCRYRMKSIERVLEELRRLGKADIFFCDDNFTAAPERTKHLLDEMLRRNIVPRRWFAQVRADVYRDAEMLELMRRTNCRIVFVGFESISEEVLEDYNKHLSPRDIPRCIDAFHAHGIPVHGMFMFGADHDDEDVFQRTAQFALAHQIDTVQFLILTPVPGSALFQRFDADGRIFTYDWSLYDGQHAVFEPARMSPLELQIGTLWAMRRFYSMGNVLRSVSSLCFGTAMLRYAGRAILRGWHKANARFLRTLREWQGGRRQFPRHFSLNRLGLERLWAEGAF
jgi:radical SAM superfamily enzyme YgiQ (UPF0313 family)